MICFFKGLGQKLFHVEARNGRIGWFGLISALVFSATECILDLT
jgi:hypothetical protein